MTERNHLEKTGEITKQVLEKRKKQKLKNFTGITENTRTRTLGYSNGLKFVNF